IAFVNTDRIHAENMSARELVAIGRSPYTDWIGRLDDNDRHIIDQALETVGIADLADRMVETLSDGECQRVMIARALAQSTPVILLDEPTAFLDMPNRYELCTLLQRLAHQHDKCIIFSTHDLDIALSLCDNIALIDSPRLHFMPTPDMIRSGCIERLFSSRYVRFDAATQSITLVDNPSEE
ncbi:MAG: ABC transporter ATP-binding protein, partial [Alistipes sp.]|nr:ABC transporter ATP-binding protein [Alistipes sp.]